MSVHFEDELARSGKLVYTTVGTSMLPMLREKRDLIILEPPAGRLQKYDVALYRDGNGKYILHRIVGEAPDGYVFRGDHNRACERGIQEKQILGVLTAFVRDGREIAVTDAAYRMYAALWCGLYWPRMAARWCLALPGRAIRKWRRVRKRGQTGEK